MEKEEEVKEKKRKKKRSNKVITTLLIILLLIAFLGIGFAIGTTELLKEFTKQTGVDATETANDKMNKSNLSVYNETVIEALKGFEQIGFVPEDAYESDITKLTKKELVVTALKGLENEQINYCKGSEDELTIALTIGDLNKSLKKAVPTGKITIEDLQKSSNDTTSLAVGGYAYKFKYKNGLNEELALKIIDNKIYVVGPCGHVGPSVTSLVSQTEKAELFGDNLYIYQKVAFGKTVYSEAMQELVEEYYTEKEYTNLVDSLDLSQTPEMSKYKTYKLTFKKNNNKYYFKSSEKE